MESESSLLSVREPKQEKKICVVPDPDREDEESVHWSFLEHGTEEP